MSIFHAVLASARTILRLVGMAVMATSISGLLGTNATATNQSVSKQQSDKNKQAPRLETLDGFYAATFSAIAGDGMGMFIFRDGRISGSDIGGVVMDGFYSLSADGTIRGSLSVKVPPGLTLIFGNKSGKNGMKFNVDFKTSVDEIANDRILVMTLFGPVWVHLYKTGELR